MRLLLPLLCVASLMAGDSDYEQFDGRAMLGINMTPPSSSTQAANGTEPTVGVETQQVYPGTAAERMGLQPGDLIVGVSGKRVGDMTAFLRQVWTAGRAGDPIALDILRPARGTLDIDRVTVNSISRSDWQRRAQPR